MGLFAGCADESTAILLYHAPIPFEVGLNGLPQKHTYGLIKDDVGEVDKPIRTRVRAGIALLPPYPTAGPCYDLLVHSIQSFLSVDRLRCALPPPGLFTWQPYLSAVAPAQQIIHEL
jgi:hypothetical protein